MKKDFKSFLKLEIKNLITLVLIVAFIIVFSAIFGSENQLIGVGLVTGLMMFYSVDLGLNKKQAPFIILGICMLMAISNIVSIYNIYLAIVFNIFTIYIFMTLSTVHLMYKTYMPFILMYIFAEGMPIEQNQITKRVLAFILSGVLLTLVYCIKHRKLQNGKTVKDIYKDISLSKETTIFNIKMTLGITIAMFLTEFFNIEKGMWISITVMSLTQPHFSMTKERIKHRFLGTVIGVVCFFILFGGLIPSEFFGIIVAILSYIYTFMKSYWIQIIFVTINSLNAANGVFNTSYKAGAYRVSFIFLGILISLFIVFLEKMLDRKVKEYPSDEEEIQENKEQNILSNKQEVLTNGDEVC